MIENDCKEGSACAIDYTQDSPPKKTFIIKKEYIAPVIGLSFLFLGIGFDFYEVQFFSQLFH